MEPRGAKYADGGVWVDSSFSRAPSAPLPLLVTLLDFLIPMKRYLPSLGQTGTLATAHTTLAGSSR